MAAFWLSLWMLLWSLLTAGSFRLPALQLLIQDGAVVEDVESYNLPTNAGSQSASPAQWEWKRAGEDGQESPQLPCRKRDGGCKRPPAATAEQSKKSLTVMVAAVESSRSVGKIYNGATTGVSTDATAALDTFGKVPTEVGTTKAVVHLSTTKNPRAPMPRVRRLAPTVGITGSQDTSQSMPTGTEKVATVLPGTAKVLGVTERQWLLVDDETTYQSMVASSDVSTATLRQGVGMTGPSFKTKGKVKFPHSTAKPSFTTQWPLVDDETTYQSMVASSDVSTATLRQGVGMTGSDFKAKGKVKFPHSTAKPSFTTQWLLVDDETTYQSMVASSDVSTATLRQGVGMTGPSFKTKGKVKFPHSTAKPSFTTQWPLVDDETTYQSMVTSSDVSTATLRQGVGMTGSDFKAKGKVKFPHSTAKPSFTTQWLLVDDETTYQSMVTSSDVSTATLRQGVGMTGPSFKTKGKVKFPHSTAKPSFTTQWPLVDDETTYQSMVASSDVSTATLRQGVGMTGSDFKAKVAVPTTATTIKVKPSSVKSFNGTTILVGKCLLWIFILALIAGIFIVATGVFATMLWRQKQAYKMNVSNHTEMVCISSLLAAEEADEAGGRPPRVKRMKMLGENGSEVDMDNLTLNSFLPEH